MSRSYRKTPICGITNATSEKEDKRINHGMFRSRERDAIRNGDYENCPKTMNEVRDLWAMDKDGKCYVGNLKSDPLFRKLFSK
jgi:hypothetical protein